MLTIKSICTTLIGGKIYKINGRTIREEKLISEGAYSFVYMAKDLNTNKLFAMKKTICQDKEQLKMTSKEIAILKSLPPHKNIVQYYGSTIIDENNTKVVLMLMEFCEKGNLLNIFEANKAKIREIHIVKIMKDIMCGLNFLHVQEIPIIHRDIKLENILCDGKGVYKICDFGSHSTSKSIHPNDLDKSELSFLREEIERNTTMMYRPPELIDLYSNFEVSTKIDIWMAGCILYLLLFKMHPFQDNSFLTILNCSYKIPNNIKFSKRILSILIMMLSKNPEERVDSTTLLYILENYLDLKKWIIHVSNDTKLRVNTVFEKIEELNKNNKHNKNVEISNGKVLDSKIENKEYQNRLRENTENMPLNAGNRDFFSKFSRRATKKENVKKKEEKSKVTKPENEIKDNKTTGNNEKCDTNVDNDINGTGENKKVGESASSIVDDKEETKTSMMKTDSKGACDKSSSNIDLCLGKTVSFSEKKQKEVITKTIENNNLTVFDFIEINNKDSDKDVINDYVEFNNGNDKKKSYNENINLFDLSDPTTHITEDINAELFFDENKKSGIRCEGQLIDLVAYEENDINFKASDVNATTDAKYDKGCLTQNNEEDDNQSSSNGKLDLLDISLDTPKDASIKEKKNLVNLNDEYWGFECNNKDSFSKSEENLLNNIQIGSINYSDNNNGNSIIQIGSINSGDNNISKKNNNCNNIRKTSNNDSNSNIVRVGKSESFNNLYDPWNSLNFNESGSNILYNKKSLCEPGEHSFFNTNSINFNNENISFNKEKDCYNHFNSGFFFNSNSTSNNFQNLNFSSCKTLRNQDSCKINNDNNNYSVNDVNEIKSNGENTSYFINKYLDNKNKMNTNYFKEDVRHDNCAFVSSFKFHDENDDKTSFNVKSNIEEKYKQHSNSHLIMSDKNDKFSELLEEFQKI